MTAEHNITDRYPALTFVSWSTRTSIFFAEDPVSGDDVAVKLIAPAGGNDGAQRFLKTAGAVQFLDLPSFPRVIDFGFDGDGAAYLVMEKIEQLRLRHLVGESPCRTLPLLIQIVDAAETLAMAGVAHLNFNPGNVLITVADGVEQVKIVGLGTAAVAPSAVGNTRFTAPEVGGTAVPAAPAAADAFSIALMAAEVLGAESHGLDREDPVVVFPDRVRAGLENWDNLEITLTSALAANPEQRPPLPVINHALRHAVPLLPADEPPRRRVASRPPGPEAEPTEDHGVSEPPLLRESEDAVPVAASAPRANWSPVLAWGTLLVLSVAVLLSAMYWLGSGSRVDAEPATVVIEAESAPRGPAGDSS